MLAATNPAPSRSSSFNLGGNSSFLDHQNASIFDYPHQPSETAPLLSSLPNSPANMPTLPSGTHLRSLESLPPLAAAASSSSAAESVVVSGIRAEFPSVVDGMTKEIAERVVEAINHGFQMLVAAQAEHTKVHMEQTKAYVQGLSQGFTQVQGMMQALTAAKAPAAARAKKTAAAAIEPEAPAAASTVPGAAHAGQKRKAPAAAVAAPAAEEEEGADAKKQRKAEKKAKKAAKKAARHAARAGSIEMHTSSDDDEDA